MPAQRLNCSFSLLDEGRQYTGNHRKYIIENAREICNSPATKEKIRLREALGFYGHGRRILAGKMNIGEVEAVTLPDGGKALIGEPVFLWNEGGDALRFSVPVRALDEQGRMLRVSVARGCMASSGGKPGEGVELNVSLPGRHDLFRLNSAEAVVVTGADMRARQALALEFSLPVSAREARKALSVRLLPRQLKAQQRHHRRAGIRQVVEGIRRHGHRAADSPGEQLSAEQQQVQTDPYQPAQAAVGQPHRRISGIFPVPDKPTRQ